MRFSGILTISLFPYGNANETRLENGTYDFHCQHREEECRGNLLEACVIKYNKFQTNLYMPVIACIENEIRYGAHVEISARSCSNFFNPTKSYSWIKTCAEVSTVTEHSGFSHFSLIFQELLPAYITFLMI
jgi:hypothetical protein